MKTPTPTFSVIIPTYGRQHFLRDAVASVLAQSVGDLECIVVDDAGDDPAAVSSDPRVHLLRRTQNGGPAAARNSGLQIATGKYICFLDDDDLYTKDRLVMALDGLNRAPVSICARATLGESSRWLRRLEGNVHDSILDDLIPSLGQVAVARESICTFDESFDGAQDLEWWLRQTTNQEVATVDDVGYLVRSHDGIRHRNGTEARIRGSLRLMEVHADYFNSHRSARSFRWRRIGLMAMSLGDTRLGARAFKTSLRARPTSRSAWHLARSVARGTRGDSGVGALDPALRSEVLTHAR